MTSAGDDAHVCPRAKADTCDNAIAGLANPDAIHELLEAVNQVVLRQVELSPKCSQVMVDRHLLARVSRAMFRLLGGPGVAARQASSEASDA
jgi:hypothetical protein